jgi:hypothetical protein
MTRCDESSKAKPEVTMLQAFTFIMLGNLLALCYYKVVRYKKHNDLDLELEKNQLGTSLAIFMASYNKGVPSGFPAASVKTLKQFQEIYPSLFKKADEWCIDRHRKRFMDWSFSNSKVL